MHLQAYSSYLFTYSMPSATTAALRPLRLIMIPAGALGMMRGGDGSIVYNADKRTVLVVVVCFMLRPA